MTRGLPRTLRCPQCGEKTLGKYDPISNFWECLPCGIGVRRSHKYGSYVIDVATGERRQQWR